MSTTLTGGFNASSFKKPNEMKKSEIKDVVKSYFDKKPNQSLALNVLPTGFSPKNEGQSPRSQVREFSIAVSGFNSSLK